MQDVFIIGSKGIPARYGGFESFVEQLTRCKMNREIKYHVACMADKKDEYTYQDARCFQIKVPAIGPAKAVYYDIAAFLNCLSYLKKHPSKNPVVYVLACRIGPFAGFLKRRLKRFGGRLFVNPDGHEWMRSKWNRPIRKYWKFSERLMVKRGDLIICDSKNMERYIKETYKKYSPKTTYIAYGVDLGAGKKDAGKQAEEWMAEHQLCAGEYYLIVGRFVPENNYEIMIREFMKSKTKKKLAIVTNAEENEFFGRLKRETGFTKDKRILFCGTMYEEDVMKKIREGAYGYIHGHEVGGTNPSLLEALGSTNLNLLLDVGFNREVGEKAALYWKKTPGSLSALIDRADKISKEERMVYGSLAKQRILNHYSKEKIAKAYEDVFISWEK